MSGMFKRLIQKALPDTSIPVGALKSEHMEPGFIAHHGIPGTGSILAYEPLLKLLAIGTTDGRIKLFGRKGVEVCLVSKQKAPCKFLEFIVGQGLLVQVTTRKDVEVWSLETVTCVASLQWDFDITAFAIAHGSPYIYIGDELGNFSVLKINEGLSEIQIMPYSVPPHITMEGLVRPFSESAPSLVGILPQPKAEYSRVILAYSNGLLVLWDLHSLTVVATRGGTDHQRTCLAEAGDRLAELPHPAAGRTSGSAGLEGRLSTAVSGMEGIDVLKERMDEEDREICSLCWACDEGSIVAAGYTDGDVALWAFPEASAKSSASSSSAKLPYMSDFSGVPLQVVQLLKKGMKVPVTVLKWCSASTPAGEKGGGPHTLRGRLYMFGGGSFGFPEVVTVVSLEGKSNTAGSKSTAADVTFTTRGLPWFGPVADIVMAPRLGADGKFSSSCDSVMVLTVPGQLHVWDESLIGEVLNKDESGGGGGGGGGTPRNLLPDPVALKFQLGESAVKAVKSKVLYDPEDQLFYSELFKKLPHASDAKEEAPPSLPSGAPWPISGGHPPPPPSPSPSAAATSAARKPWLYLTGHNSGMTQLWDASSLQLRLLATAPTNINKDTGEADGCSLHSVASIEFDPSSRLLVVAHEHGVVRVYQLHGEHRTLWRHTLLEDEFLQTKAVSVGPGLQCTAVIRIHKATVTSIAIASGPGRLALGDASGMISILCLNHFKLLYRGQLAAGSASASPSAPPGGGNRRPTAVVALAFALLPAHQAWAHGSKGKPGKEKGAATNPHPPSEGPGSALSSPAGTGGGGGFQEGPGGGGGLMSLVLYTLYSDTSLVTVDGNTGGVLGHGVMKTKSHSRAKGMYLLDASAVPDPSLASQLALKWAMGTKGPELPMGGRHLAPAHRPSPLREEEPPAEEEAVEEVGGGKGGEEAKEEAKEEFVGAEEDEGAGKKEVKEEEEAEETDKKEEAEETEKKEEEDENDAVGASEVVLGAESDEGGGGKGTKEEEAKEEAKEEEGGGGRGSPVGHPGSPLPPINIPVKARSEHVASASNSSSAASSPGGPHTFSTAMFSSPSPSHLQALPPSSHSSHSSPAWKDAVAERAPPAYLLLVSEDCLRMYPATVFSQSERHSLKKLKIFDGQGPCVWSSTFGALGEQQPGGVVLLSRDGDVIIRSLPDLAPVSHGHFSDFLGWKYEKAPTMVHSTCAEDGRMAVLATETELARICLFSDPSVQSMSQTGPTLYTKELANSMLAKPREKSKDDDPDRAAEKPAGDSPVARLPSPGGSLNPFNKMWGNMRSAISIASLSGRSDSIGRSSKTSFPAHSALDLNDLFVKDPYGHHRKDDDDDSSAAEEERSEVSGEMETAEEILRKKSSAMLELDDIDWNSTNDGSSSGSSGAMGAMHLQPIVIEGPREDLKEEEEEDEENEEDEPQHKSKKTDKLANFFTKVMDKTKQKKPNGKGGKAEDERSQLFSGGSEGTTSGEKHDGGPPRQRTAAEIKAAYGFKSKSNDAANAAADARDKLVQRGHKIQELANQTEEMESGAQEFASIAEAILKKEQNRKWWDMR